MLEVLRRTSGKLLRAPDHRRRHPRLHRRGGAELFGPGRGGEIPLGADKVSIGSDAVEAVEQYLGRGHEDGSTAIEQIRRVYGDQGVVISIDPRRVYVDRPGGDPPPLPQESRAWPRREGWCSLPVRVKGGREGRDINGVGPGLRGSGRWGDPAQLHRGRAPAWASTWV